MDLVLHLACFGEAAARDGLDYIAPGGPDALEPIGNFNGDNFQITKNTTLLGACLVTETVATMLSWRFKKATENNWRNFNMGIKADDVLTPPDIIQMLGNMQIPISKNDILVGQADNTNTSALDTIALFFGNPGDLSLLPLPFTEVVEGQATGTLVVDTWTDVGEITWSHTFTADRVYQIVGMSAFSATGHLARLGLTANDILAKPGCLAGKTYQLGNHIIWGNLGSFIGTNPPSAEFFANTADTAETVTLFLR